MKLWDKIIFMKISRKDKSRYIITVVIGILTFILLSSILTLFVNINDNKGVIPLIFILISLYYLFRFIYSILKISYDNTYANKNSKPKLIYLLYLVINLVLFLLSYIVLWQ